MSEIFDAAADRLEIHTCLDRLEARGTLRLALKAAGLDANNLELSQLQVLFDKIMPQELASRGVDDGASVCDAVMTQLKAMDFGEVASDGPEALFRQLGND